MKMKKYLPILYTAVISAALFGLLLLFRGFYPFGNGSVMLTDMYDECVPSLYRFYDIMHGYKNVFYEFQASGGLNLYTETINEVCNPFNYLLLFWKRENIYLAVNILLMLYVAGAACSAHIALNVMFDEKTNLNRLLGMCYAFSGYMAYNFQILRWMILPVIFPLFLLACIRLWKEQKGGFYAILLAYQIVLSVQHGYMTLLFVLFASGIWMYCMESKDARKRFCLGVGIYTLIGMALSAVVLLPTISTLKNSSRSGANASYFTVFEQHGLGDLFERLFQFCHPLLLGLLVVAVYTLLRKKVLKACWKNKSMRFYIILNAFLWFTVLLQPANLLWHMGSYVCFPVRYGYMLLFALICLVKALEKDVLPTSGKPEKLCIKEVVKPVAAVGLAVGAAVMLKINEYEIVRGFWTLTISKGYFKETCIVAVILLLLFVSAVLSFGKTVLSKASLFAVLVICSFCYFNMISLTESFRDDQELTYQALVQEYQLPEVNEFSDLITREKHNPDYLRNASLVNGRSSMSGYFPTGEVTYQYTLGDLGYLTPWVSTIDVGGTKISDYFFNHTFLLSKESADFWIEERMPLENQKKILDALFADEKNREDVFEVLYGEDLNTSAVGIVEVVLEEKSTIYMDAADLYKNLQIVVNGEETSLPMENMQDDPHVLMCLGTFDAGKISVEIYDGDNEVYPLENVKIGVLNESKWEQIMKFNNFDANIFKVNSKGFVCKLNAIDEFEDGIIVLPINSAKGWEVFVDDTKTSVRQVACCFLGVEIGEGNHEVELRFFPPHFKSGCVLSLLGVACLILLSAVKKKVFNYEVVGMLAERLFVVVFLSAVIVLYIIPMIGLLIHLGKRVIVMLGR